MFRVMCFVGIVIVGVGCGEQPPECTGCTLTGACVDEIVSRTSAANCGLGGTVCRQCGPFEQCQNGQCAPTGFGPGGGTAGGGMAGGVAAGGGTAGGGTAGGGAAGGGDTCQGIVCNMPPASTCFSPSTLRTFASAGCNAGACRYAPTNVTCASSETCASGACRWNDASLSALSVTPGTLAFSPNTTVYAVMLPAGTSTVSVSAAVAQPSRATIRVNGTVLASGSTRSTPAGTITVEVTAESGAVSSYLIFATSTSGMWAQQAYAKASNTEGDDYFGWSLALSGDGSTLAVGAFWEGSDATGINGDQANNRKRTSGAVYIFTRAGTTWTQQAYVKAANTDTNDRFGSSVALSTDGSTLAVGARNEASNATGINGNQADNSATESGAVYVFIRTGGSWAQQAYLKASNTGAADFFGSSVALSADGSTLAVGAIGESSNATGINGNQANNSILGAGAVYVFTRSGTTWAQQAYVKASNTRDFSAYFGEGLALSADGSTLAVGAFQEQSNATGINGNQANNSIVGAGAVYVFTRSGTTWAQQAYVKASNTRNARFGARVSLSASGSMLAVGAPVESSNATGVNGDQANSSAPGSGAVYVFARTGSTWAQQAYVKASNTESSDEFGRSVALSADGSTLAVGATNERSNATGINGNQADNSVMRSGAAYTFTRTGTTWAQQAYVKASTVGGDEFGGNVALSADGNTLAVGAEAEDSNATGLNGNQSDNSALQSGAVYIFTR